MDHPFRTFESLQVNNKNPIRVGVKDRILSELALLFPDNLGFAVSRFRTLYWRIQFIQFVKSGRILQIHFFFLAEEFSRLWRFFFCESFQILLRFRNTKYRYWKVFIFMPTVSFILIITLSTEVIQNMEQAVARYHSSNLPLRAVSTMACKVFGYHGRVLLSDWTNWLKRTVQLISEEFPIGYLL